MWKINIISGVAIVILSLVIRVFNLSILIAGYNTASKEAKKKYNEKMLVKYVSNFLAVSAAILLLGGILAMVYFPLEEIIVTLSWVAFTMFVVLSVIYLNLTDKVRA
jgi:NhaP-type Na+/H+ or K+/H+ antiporter